MWFWEYQCKDQFWFKHIYFDKAGPALSVLQLSTVLCCHPTGIPFFQLVSSHYTSAVFAVSRASYVHAFLALSKKKCWPRVGWGCWFLKGITISLLSATRTYELKMDDLTWGVRLSCRGKTNTCGGQQFSATRNAVQSSLLNSPHFFELCISFFIAEIEGFFSYISTKFVRIWIAKVANRLGSKHKSTPMRSYGGAKFKRFCPKLEPRTKYNVFTCRSREIQ